MNKIFLMYYLKKYVIILLLIGLASFTLLSCGKKKEEEPVQTEFTVELTEVGTSKVQTIKVVREITSLSLRKSKDLVDTIPSIIVENVSKEEAEKIKEKLEEIGAKVTIK